MKVISIILLIGLIGFTQTTAQSTLLQSAALQNQSVSNIKGKASATQGKTRLNDTLKKESLINLKGNAPAPQRTIVQNDRLQNETAKLGILQNETLDNEYLINIKGIASAPRRTIVQNDRLQNGMAKNRAIPNSLAAENNNLAAFIKVWGFIKYHHPTSAEGNFDADHAFLSMIATIKNSDAKTLNTELLTLISSLKTGNVAKPASVFALQKASYKTGAVTGTQLLQNVNLNWIHQRIFSQELRQELSRIATFRNLSGKHYYIPELNYTADIPNEKPYANYQFDQQNMNLLTLAKAWNAIEYLFPYKYVIGKDWTKVLHEMIPVFRNIHNRTTYETAVLLLEVAINDTHAEGFVQQMKDKAKVLNLKYYPPFDYQIYNQKILVKNFLNDAIAQGSLLKKGDLILRINGTKVSRMLKSRYKWHPASNRAVKNRSLSTNEEGGADFFSGLDNKRLQLVVQRKGEVIKLPVELLEGDTAAQLANLYLRNKFRKEQGRKGYEELNQEIGLFRAGNFYDRDLPRDETAIASFSRNLKSKKAIIIDMRGYPESPGLFYYFLPNALGISPFNFARYYAPDLSYPGTFVYKSEVKHYMSADLTANPHPYEGKIIILTDENTQSMGEWYTLMLKQFNHRAVIIGSQTAGADGDHKRLNLPGGYQFIFTGNAVFDSKGGATQRIGVKADIKFKPSADDLVFRNDPLLEKALEYLDAK
jgi:carboxyl-terminal processing protease